MQTEGEKESQDKVQEEEFSNEREKKSFFPSSKGFFFLVSRVVLIHHI